MTDQVQLFPGTPDPMPLTTRRERSGLPSTHRRARIAGALYLLVVVTAISGEFVLRGRPKVAAGLIAVACYVAVTLLLYDIFKAVGMRLALLAASSNLAGLLLEAIRWNPGGIDVAMVFHGLYCIVIGYLMFRSGSLPRILGVLMAFAGMVWLIYLFPALALDVSPYNTAIGLLGEGLPCLWLLVFGINQPRWNEFSSAEKD